MTQITVIILTKNEALHITRAIASVQAFATRIIVVDSGSTDETLALAKSAGVEVLSHPWTNHATQFNWTLGQIAGEGGWVLRLDADEVVTSALAHEIMAGLPNVAGLTIGRRMHFMGAPVRYGGVFPIRVLRLFQNGQGRCEDRWMDEHIIVNGPTADLQGCIIDDSRNTLDWWIAKHNGYASREVVDILNQIHGFLPQDSIKCGGQASVKRWIKEHLYARLPSGLRAGVYFFYRYVLRLGFLDGREARAFHVLQGFWYRYLVDVKLVEVQRHMATTGADPVQSIQDVLGITLDSSEQSEKKAA